MYSRRSQTQCGIGIRGVAIAIDSFVWFALFFVAVLAVGAVTGQIETTTTGVDATLTGLPAWGALGVWFALSIGYHSILEWATGKTIGKYLVAIRVVGENGDSVSLWHSTVRNVFRIVDWLPFCYLIGIGSLFVDDKNRRLGDRLAGTVVVRS